MAYANDVLYGAEYEVGGSREPSGLGNLQDKDIPCVVCRRRGKYFVLMIPGKHFPIQIAKIDTNKISSTSMPWYNCITFPTKPTRNSIIMTHA